MSAKDEFLKAVNQNSARAEELREIESRDISNYQRAYRELAKDMLPWVSNTPLKLAIVEKQYFDDTCKQQFPFHHITIANGSKKITIEPEGLYWVGVSGVASITVSGGAKISTNKYKLAMKHFNHELPSEDNLILVTADGSSVKTSLFDEDAFFKIMTLIA
ncbi:hypothetical protein SOD_c36280 [Serratia plymuthica 4Rx13]|uniref:Uncharacterized protein n=1 Tax=Serratia plymuthica TaxID=82996 RepID=A0A318NTS9_SERPL|nr:hypothetical protein [Serratia plymuthica]AGO56586.1 hypothetical protein SOD_c36280 [Serratia plymuthica 4Rx13]PYD36438.1 hypothetical protein CT690_24190 [Serratia plymuthica]